MGTYESAMADTQILDYPYRHFASMRIRESGICGPGSDAITVEGRSRSILHFVRIQHPAGMKALEALD